MSVTSADVCKNLVYVICFSRIFSSFCVKLVARNIPIWFVVTHFWWSLTLAGAFKICFCLSLFLRIAWTDQEKGGNSIQVHWHHRSTCPVLLNSYFSNFSLQDVFKLKIDKEYQELFTTLYWNHLDKRVKECCFYLQIIGWIQVVLRQPWLCKDRYLLHFI